MKTQCPHCKAIINAPDEYKGKKVKCMKCKESFVCAPLQEVATSFSKSFQEKTEECENCGRTIGKLEQAYQYKGKVVCAECKQRLEKGHYAGPAKAHQQTHTTRKTKSITWFVVILAVLFVIGYITQQSDNADNSYSSRRVTRPQPVERPKPATQKPIRKPQTQTEPTISDITFEEIEQLFGSKSKLTTLQKKELFKGYKGKWVKWTGQVRSSSNSWGSLTMSFRHQTSTWTSDVTVFFPKSARNTLLQLTEGRLVTYQGKLDGYGEFLGHTLKEGRIIEVNTAPPSVHTATELLKPQRSHFEIIDFSWRRDEFGMVRCAGELKNISSIPQGVEVQATARDGNGRVVAVQEFWPASINNIPPGQTYPFTYHISERTDIVTVELRVIDTRQW